MTVCGGGDSFGAPILTPKGRKTNLRPPRSPQPVQGWRLIYILIQYLESMFEPGAGKIVGPGI
jgi:hypothetical protein